MATACSVHSRSPIRGALVYLDLNNDLDFDINDEPFTTSDVDGTYYIVAERLPTAKSCCAKRHAPATARFRLQVAMFLIHETATHPIWTSEINPIPKAIWTSMGSQTRWTPQQLLSYLAPV